MKNKLGTFILAGTLVVSTATSGFAAALDFTNTVDSSKYTRLEVASSKAARLAIASNMSAYVVEGKDGNKYKLVDVQEQLGKGLTFDEAIEQGKLTPVDAPVEGELKVVEVSAINSNQAEVKFSEAVKEVKPANFKVTDKDGNLVFVSKVELNEAKDVATLTFFNKFADKATYSVEVSNVADAEGNVMKVATEAFTYLAAKVAKVEFTSTTVAPGTDLRTVVKVTDELGRDVSAEQVVEFESSNITAVPTTGIAGLAGSAIVVAKVGDVKTAPTTIKVAVQTATTFAGSYVHTGAAAIDTDAFEKLDEDKKIDYVYMEGTGNLSVYYKDQYGKGTLTAVSAFNGVGQPTLTNMTPAIVIVADDGTITPISAGDGYVKVKNGDVETTIKIVVRAKAAIATMEVEKTEVSVVETQDATVKVAFKDQFGTKTDATPTAKSAATATATAVAGTNSVVITGVKEGTTTVDVSYKIGDETVKQTINVTVVKAADLATYEAVVDTTKLDVDGDNSDDTKLSKFTNVVVNEVDANGNKIGTAVATLVEVGKDGKVIAAGEALVTIDGQKVTANAAGTAYVQVKVGSLVIDTLEFEIVKTASYAKSVEFTRNDLVVGGDKIGTLTSPIDIAAKLADIVEAKDQYGKVMEVQPTLVFTFNTTNLKDLTITTDGNVTDLVKAAGTADVVITKITTDSDTDTNLITAPVVVKLSVQATDEAIATKDVADELLNVASSYVVPALTEGSYTDETKAAAVKTLVEADVDTDKVSVGVVTSEGTTTVTLTSTLVDSVKDTKIVTVTVEGE